MSIYTGVNRHKDSYTSGKYDRINQNLQIQFHSVNYLFKFSNVSCNNS